MLSRPSRGPRRALGARLSTAHYYSRYEFEVSQRVPKVIMSRRQQRCGVSWLRGQGRGGDPGVGGLLPLSRLRQGPPLGRPPHNAPKKSPPLSPLGKIPVSAQVREMACSPEWELRPAQSYRVMPPLPPGTAARVGGQLGRLPVVGFGATLGVPLSGRQGTPSADGPCPSRHWHQ